MFCPNCGVKAVDDAKFCESCGSIIKNNAPSPVSNVANPPSYQSPPPPPAVPPPPQQWQHPNHGVKPAGFNDQVLSVGQYIGTMIIAAIPIIGLIFIFIWAFGSGVNLNKRNLARAMLILGLIGVVISIIYTVIIASMIGSMFR